MAEGGTVEQQGEGVEQLSIGPVVGVQRRALGAVDGGEVGVHVGAAEAEDRLLRVADRDQAMTGEGAVEDHPLQPVGVLELVDEDEAVAGGELVGERRAVHGVVEGGSEVADESVVADLAARLLAPGDLGDCGVDTLRPRSRRAPRRRGRLATGAGVGQHRADRLDEVALDVRRGSWSAGVRCSRLEARALQRPPAVVGRQRQRVVGEAVEEQVAHDLGDQLAVVLDQPGGPGSARPQTALRQGLLAEAVDRRDRRLVEVGKGAMQAGAAALPHTVRPGVEDVQPLLAGQAAARRRGGRRRAAACCGCGRGVPRRRLGCT